MKYSFVVPVYNAEKYLATCLDSILNQTQKDFEIILVDDGSIDSSLSICKEYEKKHNQIKVYTKKNGGAGAARKYACKYISGEYVLPVDSDDFIGPDYLSEVDRIINELHPDHIVFNFLEFHQDNTSVIVKNNCKPGYYDVSGIKTLLSSFVYDKALPHYNSGCMMYSVCIKVTSRSLYQLCQMQIPDSIRLGEDLMVSAKILQNAKSVFVSDKAYYYYRMYNASTLHKLNPEVIEYYNNTIGEMHRMNILDCNTVNVFAYRMLLAQLCSFSKQFQQEKEFVAWIRSTYKNDELWEAARHAKAHGLTIRERIFRILFVLRRFDVLYIILHNH